MAGCDDPGHLVGGDPERGLVRGARDLDRRERGRVLGRRVREREGFGGVVLGMASE